MEHASKYLAGCRPLGAVPDLRLGWVTRWRSELTTYDAAAFDHVLGAFGGMGSLNDLLILGANGHLVRPEEESAVNDRLGDLRGAIWDDTTALRRDLRESS